MKILVNFASNPFLALDYIKFWVIFSIMTEITQFLQISELFSESGLGRLAAFIDTVQKESLNANELLVVGVS